MNLKGDRIAWFASWPDSEEKVEQILCNALLLKKNGWDVGLVTQYPHLQNIDFSLLDHVIYDNTNEMYFSESESFKYGFRRIIPSCSEMRQQCGNLVFVDKKLRAPHLFSVIRLYAISMHMSVGYDYKVYTYFESDFWGTQTLCDALNSEADRVIKEDLNFVGFHSYNLKRGMNACLFLGNPKILSHHFPLHSVKSKNDFYRIYQNESVEDCLIRFFYKDDKSVIYPKDEVIRFLGEHGKDWDTSHAGFVWLESDVSERTLASFTTNAPFLEKSDFGFMVHYLFKQELINHPVKFSVSLVIRDEDQDREVFNASEDVIFNNFYYWKNVYELKINSGQILLVDTATECNGQIYNNKYEISTDFHEITGYYRLRHVL